MMTDPFEDDVREALRLKATQIPEQAVEHLRSTDYEPRTGHRWHLVRFVTRGLAAWFRRLRLPGR